jgi:hypothetical protein
MESKYINKAIQLLKATAEYSFTNDDYATIKWDILEGSAPTQAEINEVIGQIKAEEINAEATAKTAKAAATAKLAALGLTADDLKALGL